MYISVHGLDRNDNLHYFYVCINAQGETIAARQPTYIGEYRDKKYDRLRKRRTGK